MNQLDVPMATKSRSDGQTAISVSMSEDLLKSIDSRAAALGLSRSRYFAQLARADLIQRGDLVLKDSHCSPLTPPVATPITETTYHKRRRRK